MVIADARNTIKVNGMARTAKPVALFCSNDSKKDSLFDDWEELLGVLNRIKISPMTVRQYEGWDEEFNAKCFWFYTLGGVINKIDWDFIDIYIDKSNDLNVKYDAKSGEHKITFKRLVQDDRFPGELPIGKYVKGFLRRRKYKW